MSQDGTTWQGDTMALRSFGLRGGCLFTVCAVAGLSASVLAQEPTRDVPPESSSAPAPDGETSPADQAVQPNVTGKTFGGRAATSALIKEQTKQRREAARAVPKTGEWRQDWLKGPSALARISHREGCIGPRNLR